MIPERPVEDVNASVEWKPWAGVRYQLLVDDGENIQPAENVFDRVFDYWWRTLSEFGFCEPRPSPLPWKPEYEARYDPPLLAVLAERIAARAAQGKTVHLTPATADRRWRAAAGC